MVEILWDQHPTCADAQWWVDEDSEQDEQRMVARRRFSYENIDGVGDDASSDSRGRTDHDSTDEISKNEEESSFDEFNGDCESSQHTDVAGASDDDGTGSRPLLEDDALDDDEEEIFDGLSSSQEQQLQDATKSLFINADFDAVASRRNTNPFLVSASDETPKISPIMEQPMPPVTVTSTWIGKENATVAPGFVEVQPTYFPPRFVPPPPNPVSYTYAPATLPRQSTPLTAAPRTVPRLPIPMDTMLMDSSRTMPSVPVIPTQPVISHSFYQTPASIHVPAPGPIFTNVPSTFVEPAPPPPIPLKPSFPAFSEHTEDLKPNPPCTVKSVVPDFIEGPKTPKPKKSKEKDKKR
ncbi:unnamed protein product [Cylicostephanus goldi]|uniref:Uncharacterized protein n=1 Tax=Cylicostephanus goldi TaxID=71465 RepID=A0A3P6RPH0_CYLGO|nr:unnamed protein product [Cylicostephanus goldi]